MIQYFCLKDSTATVDTVLRIGYNFKKISRGVFMEKDWMGRYRALMDELVIHTNIVIKGQKIKHDIGDGVLLIAQEWQILEFLIIHEDENHNMGYIAEKLNIPQSSFSKYVKNLWERNLVEKYQTKGNRKNIILKPSQKGIDLYYRRVEEVYHPNFKNFFDSLSKISDDDLNIFVFALRLHNADLVSYDKREEALELIRKE